MSLVFITEEASLPAGGEQMAQEYQGEDMVRPRGRHGATKEKTWCDQGTKGTTGRVDRNAPFVLWPPNELGGVSIIKHLRADGPVTVRDGCEKRLNPQTYQYKKGPPRTRLRHI